MSKNALLSSAQTPEITPEQIERLARVAHRLRAQAFRSFIGGLFGKRKPAASAVAETQEALAQPIGFAVPFRRDGLRDEIERIFLRDAGEKHWSRAA
ncbi:MAG: hypothetical protein JNK11_03645 [Alphaproteobacteria bacterium]|nr:hypothetical protein [Alphaproteobacteria bacterium]